MISKLLVNYAVHAIADSIMAVPMGPGIWICMILHYNLDEIVCFDIFLSDSMLSV